MSGGIWEVVGGKETDGLVVRRGPSQDDDKIPERLATGSFVKELEVRGSRLRYRLRSGSGPAEGWIATRVGDKDLLVKGRLALDAMLFRHQPSAPIQQVYEIADDDGPLATGGYATVFHAKSRGSGERRAIKRLHLSSRPTQKECEMLKSEFEILVKLDHPNIVRFYECFQETACISFVTELCTGGPFSTYFEAEVFEHPAGSIDVTRMLFHDVVSAIAYCHDVGVIHRDMKCENCLVTAADTRRPTAKVIDFGFSVVKDKCSLGDEWLEELSGTPWYRAPEVLERGAMYGPKADMWGVGVMLYLALTGQHPFHGGGYSAPMGSTEKMSIFDAPLRQEPLEESHAPMEAQNLIEKLIVKCPSQRLDAKGTLQHEWFSSGRSACGGAWSSEGTASVEISSPLRRPRRPRLRQSDSTDLSCFDFAPLDRSRKPSKEMGRAESYPVLSDSSGEDGEEEEADSPFVKEISMRTKRIEKVHKSFCFDSTMMRARSFGKLARFERAILQLMARYSCEQQVASLKRCFKAIDIEGSGRLTKQAVRSAFRANNQHISEEALDEILLSLDSDGSGKVEYTEWLAATMKPADLAAESALHEVFRFLDLDNSGRISRGELRQVLGDEEADSIMAQMLPATKGDKSPTDSADKDDEDGDKEVVNRKKSSKEKAKDKGKEKGQDADAEDDSDGSEDEEDDDSDSESEEVNSEDDSVGFEEFKQLMLKLASARQPGSSC